MEVPALREARRGYARRVLLNSISVASRPAGPGCPIAPPSPIRSSLIGRAYGAWLLATDEAGVAVKVFHGLRGRTPAGRFFCADYLPQVLFRKALRAANHIRCSPSIEICQNYLIAIGVGLLFRRAARVLEAQRSYKPRQGRLAPLGSIPPLSAAYRLLAARKSTSRAQAAVLPSAARSSSCRSAAVKRIFSCLSIRSPGGSGGRPIGGF